MSDKLLISEKEIEEAILLISEKVILTLEKKYRQNVYTGELMTISQIAKYLQCSTQSIKNWTDRDEDKNPLIAVNAGADPRYFKGDVDAWLKREREIYSRKKRKNDQWSDEVLDN
ncbi:hypothetical protein BH20ACI4_BH20ACI4_07910 [soil metagenome]